MINAVTSFFGSMFSSSRLQDTAIDGLRKLGGLDEMNPKEKSEYILAYMAATKHQSPMRRFIAFAFVAGLALFTFSWLICSILFRISLGLEWSPVFSEQMSMLAADIFIMLKEIILQPMNIIVAFYFVTDVASKLKS